MGLTLKLFFLDLFLSGGGKTILTSSNNLGNVSSFSFSLIICIQFSSVQLLSCPTLRPHESQHTRPPCASPAPGVYSNSCPSSWWCHPAISSSAIPFSSCPQSLPASGSFPMSQLFAWGGHSIGVSASASILPMNIQDWSPLGWIICIRSLKFDSMFL